MPGLVLISGPEEEPLTLEELKAHLRIVSSTPAQDLDLGRKLKSARRRIETMTGRALIAQQWEYWFDAFPVCGQADYWSIVLPKTPILTIDAVRSYSPANVLTTLATTDYLVDPVRGRVVLNDGYAWPTDVRRLNAGTVLFTAGYGADPDAVPEDLVEAVAELAGYLFYDREGTDPVPQKVLDIVAAYEVVAA